MVRYSSNPYVPTQVGEDRASNRKQRHCRVIVAVVVSQISQILQHLKTPTSPLTTHKTTDNISRRVQDGTQLLPYYSNTINPASEGSPSKAVKTPLVPYHKSIPAVMGVTHGAILPYKPPPLFPCFRSTRA